MIGCSKDSTSETESGTGASASKLYFPPNASDYWAVKSAQELGWNQDSVEILRGYLEENGTEGFIVLKEGKIAIEWYFGDFTAQNNRPWNSAAKTLTAVTVGIAQQEGYLKIDDALSNYLGAGWSSMPPEKETQVRIINQLNMTTGLDYTVADPYCYDPACLKYKNDPGTFWYYHNAPYSLLDEVIASATETNFQDYFYEKVRDKIGMQGQWAKIGYLNLYFGNTRSLARFGLLCLNNGKWADKTLFSDSGYFSAMLTPSQDMNPSYGYLWWLNGQSGYRLPGSEDRLSGKLIPAAPDDLFAGLGALDQKLYIVPSENLVVVRLGTETGETMAGPSSFDNGIWERLMNAIR